MPEGRPSADTLDEEVEIDQARANEIAKIKPLACRFHNLRHTAVSRMLNAGVPIAKVAKIVGWSPSTMVLMAKRYGHFSLSELREAVESISGCGIEAGSFVVPPVREERKETRRPN